MGNSDTRHLDPLGFGGRWILPERRHDPKQSEASGKGEGCGGWKEEDMSGL